MGRGTRQKNQTTRSVVSEMGAANNRDLLSAATAYLPDPEINAEITVARPPALTRPGTTRVGKTPDPTWLGGELAEIKKMRPYGVIPE